MIADIIIIGGAVFGFSWAVFCLIKGINNFFYTLGLAGILILVFWLI